MIFKRFGKAPSGKRLERIKRQGNYSKGKFHNIEPTAVSPDGISFFKVLKEFITRPKTVTPSRELPHKKTDLLGLRGDKPVVVWFGHSSYYLSYNGFNILIDPVFSGNLPRFLSSENLLKEPIFIRKKTFPILIFYY